MKIYICDDEESFRVQIEAVCRDIAKINKIDCTILQGEDGEQMISCQEMVDILILDIDMPKMDGIQVKNWLQRRNRETNIIFVTNHQERIKEAFGLQVVGFVDKGRLEAELRILLQQCIQRLRSYFLIDGNYDSRVIAYIEAEHIYSRLHSEIGDDILVRQSLTDLEKDLLEVGFVRVHRSYLVNMKFIEGMITNKVKVCGMEIPVSVRQRTKVKEAYKWYCRENARYY